MWIAGDVCSHAACFAAEAVESNFPIIFTDKAEAALGLKEPTCTAQAAHPQHFAAPVPGVGWVPGVSPAALTASLPFMVFTSLSLFQIFYRVVADIEPGEELLLFMKSEDYSHETMAPDIHG